MPEQLTAPLDPLTQREMDVLTLLADGLSNREIAESLVVTSETVKWYNKQIYSKLNASNRTQAVAIARDMGLFSDAAAATGNLPAATTPFIGREAELQTLAALIVDPDRRLMTIQGPGGMGKTRLALEAAGRVASEFEHGVWLVDLAPLRDSTEIPLAIASALRATLDERRDAWAQLADFLRDRSLLLVLDNFEVVLDGPAGMTLLLNSAPGLNCLVTSRERLNLRSETVLTLGGLTTDNGNDDAYALLQQSIQQLSPGYQASAADQEAIEAICHLVDYMPLAIVLAASLSSFLTLAEIALEVQRNVDLLQSDMSDLPPRHRSIRALFNQSWQHLDPAEQKVLARLSVFRGGFGLKTARQIANASIEMLASFVRKSLINHDPGGLYSFHPVLRQYAEEKLIHITSTSLTTRTGVLLAWSMFVRGEFERAEELVAGIFSPDDALETDLNKTAFGLTLSGTLAGVTNDYDECARLSEAGLMIAEAQSPQDPITLIFGYFGLAVADCGRGHYGPAQESIQSAMTLAKQLRTPSFTLIFVPVAAYIKAQQTEFDAATRLLSFATNHPSGTPAWLANWSLLAHLQSNLQDQLGDDAFQTLWTEGQNQSLEEIIDELSEG